MPLILTLKLDQSSFDHYDALRREYFPAPRNFLAAHVTLFHHLEDELFEPITTDLAEICGRTARFPLRFTGWRFLGKGSAINIEADELIRLRGALAARWRDTLTAQDRQKFQPHITVQNKVEPAAARKVYNFLAAAPNAHPAGEAVGLTLWRYANGPWIFERDFPFTD